MFDTNSDYIITKIIFGEALPGPDTDYGVFVLRGESRYGHNKVLVLAIMKTDGKSFWVLSTDIISVDQASHPAPVSSEAPLFSSVLHSRNRAGSALSNQLCSYYFYKAAIAKNSAKISVIKP